MEEKTKLALTRLAKAGRAGHVPLAEAVERAKRAAASPGELDRLSLEVFQRVGGLEREVTYLNGLLKKAARASESR